MPVADRPMVPQEGKVSRAAGVLLVGMFLAVIALIPAVQTFEELRRGSKVQALDVFRDLGQLGVFRQGGADAAGAHQPVRKGP